MSYLFAFSISSFEPFSKKLCVEGREEFPERGQRGATAVLISPGAATHAHTRLAGMSRRHQHRGAKTKRAVVSAARVFSTFTKSSGVRHGQWYWMACTSQGGAAVPVGKMEAEEVKGWRLCVKVLTADERQ